MATMNPFYLLGDDDNEDLTQLIQKVDTKKASAAPPAAAAAPAKLPSKPVPPTQAVREARSEPGSGPRGGRGGYARGRGGRGPGPNRDYGNGNVNGFSGGYGGGGGGGGGGEDGEQNKPSDGRNRGSYGAPRQPFRGPRRGGYAGNGGDATVGDEEQRPPRRMYERRSGTGRGNEVKREGSGRGNWGTATDDVNAQDIEALNVEEKIVTPEKQTETEAVPAEDVNKENKENQANEAEEKEPEEKEMTLDEYEKIREEKRKALLALKAEERKVDIKEFASMQQIKKENEDIFIKLGSDKDLLKRRESAERDEKAKKSVSITEFLKPAEGDRHYGGRGRGRGRGERGPYRGGYGGGGGGLNMPAAPKIEDIGQFPSLGGK
ncbi:hypothetical protein QJS04_geneDACA002563 [Acorus gramineus]|uniref:Hyaluronan/mRNA-binding protein domain-containing protein n=1 Tax=Acorus gramineus TaxID=55184 RepID=A0AAV9AP39_ACOGR|nr:hypothetical protein QJS04_geneDACA002563 [Acorus gramineus]